jgi:hypothetical protein
MGKPLRLLIDLKPIKTKPELRGVSFLLYL